MKMNAKIVSFVLLSLVAYSTQSQAISFYVPERGNKDGKSLEGHAWAMAFAAPVSGAMLGCQRRTLNFMQENVEKQLKSQEEINTFKNTYVDQKIDTKLLTTATGPLSAVMIGGIMIGNIPGLVLLTMGFLGNVAALVAAEKGQHYNRDRYERALHSVNLQRALNKESQINGDAGLSDMQKMFCISKGNH